MRCFCTLVFLLNAMDWMFTFPPHSSNFQSDGIKRCSLWEIRLRVDPSDGEGNGPHSSTLAWKIPWTEETGRLQSMGSLRVRHDWVTSISLVTFMNWRRKWQPTPVVLPGESQGRGEPGGLLSMGLHRVRHDWSDLAVAVAVDPTEWDYCLT